METRAVEESFSWTPRSRRTFVREVPLLSRGRRSGLSRSGKADKTRGGPIEEGGEGRGGRGGFWRSPPTDNPNPLEEPKLYRRTLGLVYGFTQRDPPPPHDGFFGVSGEGIKRWGIEGIRIGTSDRFGRGRGE